MVVTTNCNDSFVAGELCDDMIDGLLLRMTIIDVGFLETVILSVSVRYFIILAKCLVRNI